MKGKAALLILLVGLASPVRLAAQTNGGPNPHDAQPERPTVATHAFTVAPGWVELELGVERQPEGALANHLAVPLLVKIGIGSRVQLDVAPAWQRSADDGRIESGVSDTLVGVKWRVIDNAPLVGAVAVQTTVSLPTGNVDRETGTGSAALNLLAISSQRFGPVAVDVNVGYTHSGGDRARTPANSTLWTVAAGFPVAGPVGWAIEVFGLPGTSGPAGAPPVVAALMGPTLTLRRSLVLDAGAIVDITGWGSMAIYAGATWNIGHMWGP